MGMQKELRRAQKIVEQVLTARDTWSNLYAQAPFFLRHRHYLEFDFMATSEEVHALWVSWGEKQMGSLVLLFEAMRKTKVALRPWPTWVPFEDKAYPHAQALFIGLHLDKSPEGQTEETVRYQHRVRVGRGFTLNEIKAAGL